MSKTCRKLTHLDIEARIRRSHWARLSNQVECLVERHAVVNDQVGHDHTD